MDLLTYLLTFFMNYSENNSGSAASNSVVVLLFFSRYTVSETFRTRLNRV